MTGLGVVGGEGTSLTLMVFVEDGVEDDNSAGVEDGDKDGVEDDNGAGVGIGVEDDDVEGGN